MPVLEFRDYHYAYPDGTEALSGISFSVEEGESLGIVGPNGAGKTTMLLSSCGLLEGEGHVLVHGEILTKKNAGRLRQSLGFVFQNPDDQLFMPTVYEDVAFGPDNLGYSAEAIDSAVEAALEAVELPDFGEKSSHHLSSGEKKRVAVATVLSMKPDVLILDEPSTNLDPHARRNLIELFAGMEITQIIAGHDLELILELCDRVLIMNRGRIVADGQPGLLFSDTDLMRQNFLEVPYSLR
ncbi:MAG: energy-coupling factor ABC transporter ATP-binding protein [Candidatus Marinimicrobia bacterium]|nr:energy-coupling factor ABC transporter ATP-binding protein [Candidatus Neomarinimicrobiota bacterium]MCF7829981.1 energy-coupling factor ABC transporter ATP-binding protein [Candidatus Neomarinimicrobiota bacterium]MCF7881865.1 energy-coupling factor ABC transporter ATP-binding protein [Candidatus Neomarinimicrobiota bacterium]